jgi:hypothetical protein
MTLTGVLWAAFAPLLLVVAIAVLALMLRRFGVARAWVLAAALVLLPVAALYGSDRREFSVLCDEIGLPVIHAKAKADGVLLVSGTASSFGMRYLHDEGFAWIELRDIYRRDGWARAARDDKGRSRRRPSTRRRRATRCARRTRRAARRAFCRTQVIDRQTGVEMARGANANFDGGRAKWAARRLGRRLLSQRLLQRRRVQRLVSSGAQHVAVGRAILSRRERVDPKDRVEGARVSLQGAKRSAAANPVAA